MAGRRPLANHCWLNFTALNAERLRQAKHGLAIEIPPRCRRRNARSGTTVIPFARCLPTTKANYRQAAEFIGSLDSNFGRTSEPQTLWKRQAPRSKLQINTKLQTPRADPTPLPIPRDVAKQSKVILFTKRIGSWDLELLWILDLGVWIFPLRHRLPTSAPCRWQRYRSCNGTRPH